MKKIELNEDIRNYFLHNLFVICSCSSGPEDRICHPDHKKYSNINALRW